MASSNDAVLLNHLFQRVVPIVNERQAGSRPNHQQLKIEGRSDQNKQRHNVQFNQPGQSADGRHGARGSQQGANRGNQSWKMRGKRNLSIDRSVMCGSRESLPGVNSGRRHHSVVRNRNDIPFGSTGERFECRHDSGAYSGGNSDGQQHRGRRRVGRGSGNGRITENNNKEDGKRHGAVKQVLGFKRLEDLTKKEPEEILKTLANSTSGFEDLLTGQLRPDLMILVVKVLAKACKAAFLQVKVTVLANACGRHFIDQLSHHIGAMLTDEDKRRKEMLTDFLDDLFVFCHTTLSLLPANAVDVFPQLFCTLDGALRSVERYQGIKMEDKIKQFDELQNLCVEAKKDTGKKISKAGEVMQFQDPPNNYREISLYPSSDDIFSEIGETHFIRPNIVRGSYASVEHYLDVQFRLLREDFVKPLREGIQECTASKVEKAHRFGSVRFYPKVIFRGTKAVNNNVGLLVCFDPDKRMLHVKWEFCRRFMFGSLLCFTKDNFQSIVFGKVLERNLNDLKRGNILVDLCDENGQQMHSGDYKMIESEVYFEPYFNVMKALQNMDEDSFPMSQYIVQVQPHSNLPSYLHGGIKTYQVDAYNFPVQNESMWPSSSNLKLDDSQYKALKSALTKEFVVIQGPPGTGKTYLGLKVAAVLLKNGAAWNYPRSPILVVCFTNHALDQFLEGLLNVTRNLVRVGGQSKNENLSQFSLRERRQCTKRTRELGSLMKDRYAKISALMWDIKRIQKDLEIVNGNHGIFSLSTLKSVCSGHHNFNTFKTEDGVLNNLLLLKWLMSDKDEYGRVDRRGEQVMNKMYPPGEDAAHADEYDHDMELADENVLDDEIDFGIDPHSIVPCVSMALELASLESEISKLKMEISSCNETVNKDVAIFNRRWVLEDKLADTTLLVDYIKMRLQEPQPELHVVVRLASHRDLRRLTPKERWVVYRYWVSLLRDVMMRESTKLGVKFRNEMKNMAEIKMMDDLEVLESADVVGMTTTGAARLQPLLQALKPKIVIVEEAAEVMESHIVVSLTDACQHLILIGDHQQLRPTTADYHLARKFYFDISLFERMLKNGMHCETLKVQHRMRPEIAKLIVPAIYPELLNHESVLSYETILGIEKSVFFIAHNHPEDKVEDSASRKNSHEGDFVIALCRYLLMQGYSSEQITILATYSGQMFYLRGIRKNHEMLRDVKMTVVDNFQGEENDIILLSLVRSNEEAKIGFLSIENRVCVALSRARKGFYIIGNMDNMAQSSELWKKIKSSLVVQGSFGEVLTLRCQVHPTQLCQVKTASDFAKNVPEGGCMQPCKVLMPCGHYCPSVCHIQDRDHKLMKCLQDCSRSSPNCTFYHKCPKRCWEECGNCEVIVNRNLPCGHSEDLMCHIDHRIHKCWTLVTVTLPHCGHVANKPCHSNIDTFCCPHPCEDRLSCGHSCELNCHVQKDPDHLEYKCRKPCTKTYKGCTHDHKCAKRCHEDCGDCTVKIKKKLECGHTHKVPCSMDPAAVECHHECKRIMQCGHLCKKLCYEECGDCQVQVKKPTAGCGHIRSCKCCEMPDPSRCMGECIKMLPCGHKCTGRCRDPCNKACMELVPSTIRIACGHAVELPCHIVARGLSPDPEELLQYCRQPCGAILQCEHKCKGTCGDCLQGRIHMPCGEKCGRVLICGHSCEIPCAESCPPCMQKCSYRCKHSICSRKCGQPCIQCTEPCEVGCVHRKCTKLCFQPCNVEPCTRPCKELRPCGHPCIGYCGDPCPPLCRVCNEEDVTEIFFGDEDEEDARFVYLEDCKHTLLGEGLEEWLKNCGSEISMKGCPKCKTPIMRTQRYINMIKAVYQDVVKVKAKVFGDMKAIEASREQLKERLQELDPSKFATNVIISGSETYQDMYQKLFSYLQPLQKDRRKAFSIVDATTIRIQIDILTELVTEIKNVSIGLSQKAKLTSQLDVLLGAVGRNRCKTTAQEVEDVNVELLRFKRLIQFLSLEDIIVSKGMVNNLVVKNARAKALELLQSKRKYAHPSDEEVKALLEGINKAVKGGLNISEAERKEILAAIGVTPGHWFKCPNGHIYVITECGGAMEEGRCNECGEKIGGGSHALLPSNSLANEMDGAQFAAWSNQQNMMDYDFNFID